MSKIVVALSGGVDSSVAAALLKQQGHDITGMMLRLWSEVGREDTNRCCSPDSMALARRVAAKLDIPFYVVDAKDIFRQTIVKYFLDGYGAGRTPNPCLPCNRLIRWEFLLSHALDMGAEYLATGHYVRIRKDERGKMQILRAVDRAKDQSYILHVLTQDKLARALFPVGEYPKPEVRELARNFDLPTASRTDSQDLCFLAGEDYRGFIHRNAPYLAIPGPIRTRTGETLGEHTGLADYTIGQRKGLGIFFPVPLYVIAKDPFHNTLIVGLQDELGSRECAVTDMNWVSGEPPTAPFRAEVKTRYTATYAWAEVKLLEAGERAVVNFDSSVRDITPGQAAVFYAGDIVLGGGMITEQCA
jgi:tRNA-specific 2-thiouridylase